MGEYRARRKVIIDQMDSEHNGADIGANATEQGGSSGPTGFLEN